VIRPHVGRGAAADEQVQVDCWRRAEGQLKVDKPHAVGLLVEHDIVYPQVPVRQHSKPRITVF
jgi:hypothetical protein